MFVPVTKDATAGIVGRHQHGSDQASPVASDQVVRVKEVREEDHGCTSADNLVRFGGDVVGQEGWKPVEKDGGFEVVAAAMGEGSSLELTDQPGSDGVVHAPLLQNVGSVHEHAARVREERVEQVGEGRVQVILPEQKLGNSASPEQCLAPGVEMVHSPLLDQNLASTAQCLVLGVVVSVTQMHGSDSEEVSGMPGVGVELPLVAGNLSPRFRRGQDAMVDSSVLQLNVDQSMELESRLRQGKKKGVRATFPSDRQLWSSTHSSNSFLPLSND